MPAWGPWEARTNTGAWLSHNGPHTKNTALVHIPLEDGRVFKLQLATDTGAYVIHVMDAEGFTYDVARGAL